MVYWFFFEFTNLKLYVSMEFQFSISRVCKWNLIDWLITMKFCPSEEITIKRLLSMNQQQPKAASKNRISRTNLNMYHNSDIMLDIMHLYGSSAYIILYSKGSMLCIFCYSLSMVWSFWFNHYNCMNRVNHIKLVRGNSHHIIEAAFIAFTRLCNNQRKMIFWTQRHVMRN